MEMTAGTLSSGTATSNGGNIHISGANNSLTMSGGTITSGRANAGGNIRANGVLNISGDALIQYGGAIAYGGNLFSPNGSNVTMSGGTITNGGQAALTDGVWTSDSAMNKGWTNANVVNEGNFVMTGGTITGTYTCWSYSKLTLSGDARIYAEGGNGLNVGGTVTFGKFNIGESANIQIFTWASETLPKKVGTLASDVTYTEAELNAILDGRAWDAGSNEYTFYLDGSDVYMKLAE